MTAYEILTELFEALRQSMPEVDFRTALSGEQKSRLIERITVTGQVEGEENSGGAWSAVLGLKVYLPRGSEPSEAEPVLEKIAEAAGSYSQLSGIKRGSPETDKVARLLTIPCALSFSSASGGGGGGGGSGGASTVKLGGVEYPCSGWKTSITAQGEELISIGEVTPFAVRNSRVKYTVELYGIDCSGLERLASFSAELGDGTVYLGCRFKSISESEKKAAFVSYEKV